MKDPHRILDLPDTATPEEIRARYLQLVRIFHPDRYRQEKDRAFAEARLKEINDAYEALLQPSRPLGMGQPRLPEPVLWPESIDFGTVAHGQVAQRRVQVGNAGARAESLHFHFGDGQSWFSIVKGQRLNPAQPLPLNLDIEADTAHLTPNQTYESWLDVEMDGMRARLPLTLRVVDIVTDAPAKIPWLAIAATVLIGIGLVLLLPFLRSRGTAPTGHLQGAVGVATTSTQTNRMATSHAAQTPGSAQEPVVAVLQSTADLAPEPTISTVATPASTTGQTNSVATASTAPVPASVAPTATPPTAAAVRPPATASTLSVSSPSTFTQTTSTLSAGPTALPAQATRDSAIDESSEPERPVETPEDSDADAAPTVANTPDPPVVEPGTNVTIRVPDAYQVHARSLTSVESPSLGLLDKGAVFPAIARTIDNAWTRIVLPDGREAWVFTESMDAEIASIATLPVVFTDAPTQVPDAQIEPADAPSPAPAAVSASDAQATTRHVVQAGEFLKQLAVVYYGDEELWTLIYAANADTIGPNPDLLTAGQELVIPPAPNGP